ncbi:MAG TPA: TRAP transporter large permease subunit [Candidatus Elarobacter sp.]|jgi:tripartite ATP-independent transporter DctM subunit|nr:TRAP transporter large permease subunit [Candidatus Elarobacter sp.]
MDAAETVHVAAETAVAAHEFTFRRPWAAAIDRAIGAVVEPIAAFLVVVEVAILSAGVFTRYVLGNPLVWSDELATLIFLWLAMLGAVVAYRRGEHISLSVLVRRASPKTKALLETISSVVTSIFVIELIPATIKFFNLEKIDLTPALNIPRSYEVLAVILCLAIILVLALLRLSEQDPKVVATVVAAAVVISAVAWFGRGAFVGLGNFNLVLFFVVLVGACVAIGVPIAFAFGLGTLSYLAIVTTAPLSTVVGRMQEGVSNLVLLAVPLFIFLGLLMETAGIAQRLVGALASLVGHLRGGLSIVLVGAMYLVSGISGSKIADMAAVAPVLFPDMERRGQKRTSMIALLATSGAMAETIPPSLVLIIIGSVTGVSIQAMFTAGLLPAFVLSLFLIAVALWDAKRENVTLAARAPMKVIARAFFIAIPGLILPLVIRYFVVAGIATATEVSVVGIIYTLLVGVLVYRVFDWRTFYPTLKETVSLAGAILLIIATATAMGWALTRSGFAQQLADILGHAPGGKAGIMLLSIVMFIILGSVLEGIPAMVLFGPLLFPVAKAAGINEVHYAIVVVLAMGVGLFSPPVGIGFFAASAIGKANPEQVVKPMLPYLIALMIGLLIVAYVPWISLGFLPKAQGQ